MSNPGDKLPSSDSAGAALARAASPVRPIPTDPDHAQPERGIALCLSGGGYRAMLFHVGTLWRLNELRYLPRVERISSVSGGSITAGVLGRNWNQLLFNAEGVAQGFVPALVEPVRALAHQTIDINGIVRGVLLPGSVADRVAAAYRKHLFDAKTLQDLPAKPRFVINATNLQSGVLWRFSRPYMWDYRVGKIADPTTELAIAVAASSAFPPFLSPLTLKLDPATYEPNSGHDLQTANYMRGPILSDGGVYDNLGLETAWKRYQTILVSDGGGHFSAQSRSWSNWAVQSRRVLSVVDSQVRALRKRQVIGSYQAKLRQGAYWSIWSETTDFHLDDALPYPDDRAKQLARIPTRLARLDKATQQRLINWGYTICDTAMRKHVERAAARPATLPYPNTGP